MPSPYTGLKIASILLNSDGGLTFSRFFQSFFEYNDEGVAVFLKWFKTPWLVKKIWATYVRYIKGDEIWAGLIENWREQTVEEQWKLVSQREAYRAQWHKYLNDKEIDILLCVPNATPAVPKDGMKESLSSCGYTFLFNLVSCLLVPPPLFVLPKILFSSLSQDWTTTV